MAESVSKLCRSSFRCFSFQFLRLFLFFLSPYTFFTITLVTKNIYWLGPNREIYVTYKPEMRPTVVSKWDQLWFLSNLLFIVQPLTECLSDFCVCKINAYYVIPMSKHLKPTCISLCKWGRKILNFQRQKSVCPSQHTTYTDYVTRSVLSAVHQHFTANNYIFHTDFYLYFVKDIFQ